MALNFPDIDPMFISLGPISIKWYALSYIVGILFACYRARRVFANNNYYTFPKGKSPLEKDDLLPWLIFGILFGGRIGYIVFYNFSYYWQHPLDMVKIWNGGMSFHGALIGGMFSIAVFAWLRSINVWKILDVLAISLSVGIFLGRIANFVNGELYGRVADVSWAVMFPSGGYLPRHPSQLYEALVEGTFLFIVINLLFYYTNIRKYPGVITALWLIGYGIGRIILEQFREPDAQIGFLYGSITMGQMLTLPMLLGGFCIIVFAVTKQCSIRNIFSRG